MPFPPDNQRFTKKPNGPANCTINGVRYGNVVAVFGHFLLLGCLGEYFNW